VKFEQQKALDRFREDVEKALLVETVRHDVVYPVDAVCAWNVTKIAAANEGLLAAASGTANLYALFTAPRNSRQFGIRYIGKTTRKLARQRLWNHLITKNEGTGARLDKVKAHVRAGGSVKVAWVTVECESLRNYLEAELIDRHPEADWNHRRR
jgi:cysteine synthase